jgi:hypothetical protein
MLLKKSWRNFLLLIIFTISATFPIIVFADETPIPYDYMQDVGEKYVFVMLSPYDPSGWGPDIHNETIRSIYSKSGLYIKNDSPVLVWILDPDLYLYQAEISSDGKYLIEWALLSYRYSDYDSIAFTLFENGQEVRKYAINEFVSSPFLISSPYEWKENSFIDNEKDTLWIRTSSGEEYTIDLATGEIVKGISPKTKIKILAFGMSFLILIVVFAVWRIFRRVQAQKQI